MAAPWDVIVVGAGYAGLCAAHAGPPTGVVLAGHLVALVLAARLLGITERLMWQSRSLLTVVRRLLVFPWPLLRGRQKTGPSNAVPRGVALPMSELLVRLNEGRAPPSHGPVPFVVFRPTPTGGPRACRLDQAGRKTRRLAADPSGVWCVQLQGGGGRQRDGGPSR
ncbi:hypothetical protein ACGFNV_44940, partial [Streptomyces sp. NPDC048751]